MERRDEIFLVLAEELHFGRTAELLHVSQARVSLTPIGQRLRDDLAPAHQRIQEAFARAVDAAREQNTALRLGFAAPSVADLIGRRLATLRERGFRVQIREAAVADPVSTLRAGEVGALVTLLPVTDVVSDAPPVRWGLVWRHGGEPAAVRALAEAA